MEEIMTVPIELMKEAENVSIMRGRLKEYLKDFGECHDKFTITKNDTFLGHVSESAIIGYLEERYGDRLEIKKWSDNFDMKRINSAIENNDGSPDAVAYVKKYFYDEYDLKIIDKSQGNLLRLMLKLLKQVKNRKIRGIFFIQ